MTKTMLLLAAAGLATYGLIFLVYAQSGAPTPARAASAGDLVIERAPASPPEEKLATLDTPEVSKNATEGGDELFTAAPEPKFEGDPWQVGVKAFEEGDADLAVEALEIAVREREDSPYAHYLLGLAHRRAGAPDAAVLELTRSLELAPGNVRALVHLGRAQLELGETDEARASVDRALELDVDAADAWQVLGRIELQLGHWDEAAAAFGKAVERDPSHAYAWNNLGYVRIQQGRYEAALEPLRQATSASDAEGYFFNNLGIVLEQLDDLGGATLAFHRAMELGHGAAEISLGRVETVLIARGETPPSPDSESTEEVALTESN